MSLSTVMLNLRLKICRLVQPWTKLTRRRGQVSVEAFMCFHKPMPNSQDSRMSHDCTFLKRCARQVFDAGVQAVLPNQMVKDALHVDKDNGILTVNQQQYTLDHNIHIVAFGKAVIGMVRASEDVLGEHVVDGIASIPFGIQTALCEMDKMNLLPLPGSKVKLVEGAKDNLPDEASHQAATEIMELTDRLTEQDIMLVLISGGGSALLPAPAPPITLEEKLQVIRALALRGASIEQLNTVRKNLSMLKGGKLAKLALPAKVIGLILSDIIGDPVDLIASAPTMPNQSTAQDCLAIFNQYRISEESLPSSIYKHLEYLDVSHQKQSEFSSDSPSLANNVIIGSNSIAISRSCEMAKNLGFAVFNISNAIDGEASVAAQTFLDIALYVCERYSASSTEGKNDSMEASKTKPWFNVPESKIEELETVVDEAAGSSKPVCILGAGETTVTVRGHGCGGRNQELALAASIEMGASSKLQAFHDAGFKVILLSGGTDGQDGPTDAAGAIADIDQVTRAKHLGLDPMKYLSNNDSHTFYKTLCEGQDLLVTGLTGTNVMDLQILLVYPPK